MIDFTEQIRSAKNNLTYLNKRVSGVRGALKGQTNDALVDALNKELSKLQQEIKDTERRIRNAENELREIERRQR